MGYIHARKLRTCRKVLFTVNVFASPRSNEVTFMQFPLEHAFNNWLRLGAACDKSNYSVPVKETNA